MATFEEHFKTKAQPAPVVLGTLKMKPAPRTPTRVSLMEPNRAKNLAITLRKEGVAASDICCAIETYVPENQAWRRCHVTRGDVADPAPSSQVQPDSSEPGLPGAAGALHPLGVRDQAHPRLRVRGQAPGRARRGGPLHGALQQDPAAPPAHQHAHLHGQLSRERAADTAGGYAADTGSSARK